MKTYFGAETKKALKNFPFQVHRVHSEFIRALVMIKKAAALANAEAKHIPRKVGKAISKAADEVLMGKFEDQFPLPALQGGAGTSINMNVNEVLAARATEILGDKIQVHPNDHVNRSQSTNDVNPSAIKVASLLYVHHLQKTLAEFVFTLQKKAKEFSKIPKLARTHLQDAVPTTLGAEFESFADIIFWHQEKINRVVAYCEELNLGGTAIGSSANASPAYRKGVYKHLNKITRENFRPAKNLMSQTSSQTDFLAVSQAVTALCVDLSKIASDIRLLSSGPRGGFGEITLPELQKGSSIMPGKVNPVLPETVNQLYYVVSGNNITIEHSAHAAQLELGVMFPSIADRLLQSLKLTAQVIEKFSKDCVLKLRANTKRCKELLENSTALATFLTPKYGYDTISALVKKSVKENKSFKAVVLESEIMNEKEWNSFVKNI